MENKQKNFRAYIWFGMIGALLAVINNIIATIGLGVFQGPFVAFTTPFAFALVKFMFPKKMGATLIYIPVIITSIFTINFGPPGPYKLLFIIGAVFYDLICYVLQFHKQASPNYKMWKLIVAVAFYPIGLFIGALIAIYWILTPEIPFISKGFIGAIGMIFLFIIIGYFSTLICFRIYKKFLYKEINEISDET